MTRSDELNEWLLTHHPPDVYREYLIACEEEEQRLEREQEAAMALVCIEKEIAAELCDADE
jgi:hypothetical protein